MYGLFGRGGVRDLTPEEVAAGLTAGDILLIDVREPKETDAERIPGALLAPLSQFDPINLPDPEIAQAAGLGYDAHLAGGLKAWKAAGLPTEK
jgi:rhodanese-related sulfurtransferase